MLTPSVLYTPMHSTRENMDDYHCKYAFKHTLESGKSVADEEIFSRFSAAMYLQS